MNVAVKLTGTPIKALFLLCCLAAGLATQAHAGEATIHPTITGAAQLYLDDHGGRAYSKSYGGLHYGFVFLTHYAYWYQAFLKFGLDSLPDTCVIVSAELDYYQGSHSVGLPEVDIKIIRDPESLSAGDLYSEIGSAPAITPLYESQDGWMSVPFDTAAFSLLDSCRHAGTASFSVHYPSGPNFVGYAYGYDGEKPPYLRIEYTVSGTREAQGTLLRQPVLSMAPNPTAGGFITVRHDVAAGTRGKLTLRDALGRTMESFAPVPSGSTRLDLRDFAPGVYMATLGAGSQSLTRKLVITSR